jgi:hypothetical protein
MEYRNHRYIDGPGVDLNEGCGTDCRMIFYCQTMANDFDEWQFCRDNNKDEFGNGVLLSTLEDLITHNWYVTRQ